MNISRQHVVFTLDEQRYTLPLAAVERVVHAVYVTPLPKAPEVVLGIINIQGQIMPVINLRKRFCLPEREIDLDDQFIVAHTPRRTVVLVVDTVMDIAEFPEHTITARQSILSHMEYVAGVIKHDDGVMLIHDLDACLSLEEEDVLDMALQAA